jgi:hypothetical protein
LFTITRFTDYQLTGEAEGTTFKAVVNPKTAARMVKNADWIDDSSWKRSQCVAQFRLHIKKRLSRRLIFI